MIRTVVSDKDTHFVLGTLQQQFNILVEYLYGSAFNKVDAAPTPTIGTEDKKTLTIASDVAVTLGGKDVTIPAATVDKAWTVGGNPLAPGMTRRYLLVADATGAKSAIASDDQKEEADCMFSAGPGANAVALSIATIKNESDAPFVPGETDLDTAGITLTFASPEGDAATFPVAKVVD